MDTAEVLALFDRQMRRDVAPSDPAVRVERDEQTVLFLGDDWNALLWSKLDEATADRVIARIVARLRELPGHVEWKVYAHDRPGDLAERLLAAGLVPDEEEAVLVAELDALPALDDAEVQVADTPELIDVWVEVNTHAFGENFASTGRELRRALERDPIPRLGVVAYVDGTPVSAGRIDFDEHSDFASIWGGGTVPEWRGRGMYRATVAKRAALARERGYRYLQVDALPTSRPILERLGFVQVTTTTPYVVPRS